MDYVVCIPSYKRSLLLKEKTLSTLLKHKISPDKIYIYVANKDEYDEYDNVLDKGTYNKLIVGKKGLVPQRQFIMEQWGENKHIVFFDDDLKTIDLSMSGKDKTLDGFIKRAFYECVEHKSYIWGVYPVFNPFFRKGRPDITTCLNYIVGAFYGIINRPKLKSLRLTLTAENGQKEDVERTIKYFIEDGIVLRFNKIGFETKYYGKEGGLGTFEDRLKPMLEASKKLKEKYPEYGDIVTRPSGMTEFRLKRIPSRMVEETEKTEKTEKTKTTQKNKSKKNKTIKKVKTK